MGSSYDSDCPVSPSKVLGLMSYVGGKVHVIVELGMGVDDVLCGSHRCVCCYKCVPFWVSGCVCL